MTKCYLGSSDVLTPGEDKGIVYIVRVIGIGDLGIIQAGNKIK